MAMDFTLETFTAAFALGTSYGIGTIFQYVATRARALKVSTIFDGWAVFVVSGIIAFLGSLGGLMSVDGFQVSDLITAAIAAGQVIIPALGVVGTEPEPEVDEGAPTVVSPPPAP